MGTRGLCIRRAPKPTPKKIASVLKIPWQKLVHFCCAIPNSIAHRQGTSKREGAQSVNQSVSDKVVQKPLTPPSNTQIGWKPHKEGLKLALHRIFDHCEWLEYQKKLVSKISIFDLQRVENYPKQVVPYTLETGSPQNPNRVKNTSRGHSSINVHWSMYRGRGAGRWAESSSGARVLPYKPPA